MNRNLLLFSVVLLVAACAPKAGKTTKIGGKFAEDAPAVVELMMGNVLDTTIVVTDGRFEAEIPTNLTTMAMLQAGDSPISFLADGSTITIDPEAGTAVSSIKNGPQARYAVYNAWMEKFFAEYRSKMAEFGEDEEAAEEYFNGIVKDFDDYQKEAAKANADSFVGLMAINQITNAEPEEILALLNGLSEEMKATPQAVHMLASYENRNKTAEGSPFVDFTVVQDPEHPETSTVKLSDYVGKGKYVLVDFWASWCGPCREEMPYLIEVYKAFAGPDFDMLSVAVADAPEDSKAAAPQFGIVWNQIVNSQQIPTELYGIEGIPHIILFGPDGTILKRDLRGDKIAEAVREVL